MNGKELDLIEEHYEANRYEQAFRHGQELFGPLTVWPDQVLAGKVATQVGGPRLGSALHLRAGRNEPHNASAQFRAAIAVGRRFGPWDSYLYLQARKHLFSGNLSLKDSLGWLSTQLEILCDFRDFQQARDTLQKIKGLASENEWTLLSEASLLQAEDRRPEALLLVEESLTAFPESRPFIQMKADLLETQGQIDQAIEFLECAQTRLHNCWLTAQLAQLLNSVERFEQALTQYQRFKALQLLPDKDVAQWLDAGLFRCYYRLDRQEEALRHVGDKPGPALLALLENLQKAGPEQKRRCLDLEYIRQNHSTCGPATVTSISMFWEKKIDHLELADEICYDGTTHSSLRNWAEKNGWVARELTLDWTTARALIDRGIPVALTTVEADSAHLQAVAGYDENLGLLLLRDPSVLPLREVLEEKFFEKYLFCGPRAMILVPQEEASRIDLSLPDETLYDLLYELDRHLESENRARAEQTINRLRSQAPEHRLTHQAELTLASYDENLYSQLEAIRCLRNLHPKSEELLFREYMILAQLGHEKEANDLLEEKCAEPNCRPLFQSHLANNLLESRENHDRAARLLKKTICYRRDSFIGYFHLAKLRWRQHLFDEALQLKRIASCLQSSSESLALEYFEDCQKLDRTEEGLSYLSARKDRYLEKRPASGQTFVTALELLRRTEEAHNLLEELLQLHPHDSGLNLFACDFHARYGNFEKASHYLDSAKHNASELNLLRTVAKLEFYQGRLAESARMWEKVVRREPSASDAVSALSHCYQALGENEKAVAAVRGLVDDYPHNVPLKRLYYSVQDDNHERLLILDSLLEMTPTDPWVWSRRALVCHELGENEKSDASLERALKLAPRDASVRLCQGRIRYGRGELEPAKDALREAIRCNMIEGSPAVLLLLGELCAEPDERRKELDFLWKEIEAQTTAHSPVTLLYQSLADGVLEPESIYRRLVDLREQKPDSLELLVALSNQTLSMKRLDEALELALETTRKFPHDVMAWNKLSDIYRAINQPEKERDCLKRALDIEPTSSATIRRLADSLSLSGQRAQAYELIQQGVAVNPQDHLLLGYLAEAQWLEGEREKAVATLQRAVKIESDYGWGWNKLAAWSTEHPSLKSPVELAREFVEERPKDSRNWLRLFEFLPQDAHQSKLEALNKALALSPLDADLHDAKIVYLTELNLFEEALQACTPPVWQGRPPIQLQGRRCWVQAKMGRLDDAIAEIRTVLSKEPEYLFGIVMLSRWLSIQGERTESLRYLRRAAELQPDNSQALLLLAQALEETGEDSRDVLRQALRADPTESHLLHHLLETDLERQDSEAVMRDMDEWNHLLLPDEKILFRFILECREKNAGAAEELLEKLARTSQESWVLLRAIQTSVECEFHEACLDLLARVGREGSGTLQAGVQYYTLLEHQGVPRIETIVRDFPPGPFRSGMLGASMDELSESEFDRLMSEYGQEIQGDTYSWAKAMRRLLIMREPDYERIVAWSDDWEQRQGLESWMLFNRATALREMDRKEEAHALLAHADISLPPDTNQGNLKTLLALGYLETGQRERAVLNLAATTEESLMDYYKVVYFLVSAHLEIDTGNLVKARDYLLQASSALPFNQWDKSQKQLHIKTLKAFSARRPDLKGRLFLLNQMLKREQMWPTIWGALAVLALQLLRFLPLDFLR